MKITQQLTVLAGCCLLALLCGCDAGSPKAKLVGKWEMDVEAAIKKAEDKAKTENDQMGLQMVKALMKDMKMQMEFTADGKAKMTVSAMGNEQTDEGNYEIKSSDGDTIVVSITGTKKPAGEMKITFINKDTVEISDPASASKQLENATFKRVK